VDDQRVLPAANEQPRSRRRHQGFPLMPPPEATRPTTELNLASGEQVALGIQLLTVLNAEPFSREAYLGRVFILMFASPP